MAINRPTQAAINQRVSDSYKNAYDQNVEAQRQKDQYFTEWWNAEEARKKGLLENFVEWRKGEAPKSLVNVVENEEVQNEIHIQANDSDPKRGVSVGYGEYQNREANRNKFKIVWDEKSGLSAYPPITTATTPAERFARIRAKIDFIKDGLGRSSIEISSKDVSELDPGGVREIFEHAEKRGMSVKINGEELNAFIVNNPDLRDRYKKTNAHAAEVRQTKVLDPQEVSRFDQQSLQQLSALGNRVIIADPTTDNADYKSYKKDVIGDPVIFKGKDLIDKISKEVTSIQSELKALEKIKGELEARMTCAETRLAQTTVETKFPVEFAQAATKYAAGSLGASEDVQKLLAAYSDKEADLRTRLGHLEAMYQDREVKVKDKSLKEYYDSAKAGGDESQPLYKPIDQLVTDLESTKKRLESANFAKDTTKPNSPDGLNEKMTAFIKKLNDHYKAFNDADEDKKRVLTQDRPAHGPAPRLNT